MRLIGFADGTYISKKDGKKKEGYRFYFTDSRDNVAGLSCECVWCQKTVGDAFLRSFDSAEDCLGMDFIVHYNRWGSAIAFQPVAASAASRK